MPLNPAGMDTAKPQSNNPQSTGAPARIYDLKPFSKSAPPPVMNPGPGRSGAPAPPAPALIHQKSNSGIEVPATEEKPEEQARVAVANMILQLPGRLRKKMFAIRSRVEWLVQEYGMEHIGFQTLIIRENIADGKVLAQAVQVPCLQSEQ